MINRLPNQFTADCTKKEVIFGWIYLVIHIFVLPLALAFAEPYLPFSMTEAQANLLYYGISLTVVLLVFWKLLRREFDHMLDHPILCMKGFLFGNLIWYGLSVVMTLIMLAFGLNMDSPNDQSIDAMADTAYNVTAAISVFFAPILEEILFRGVAFQSLRKKNRILAYAVSMGLFAIYHVWQYALVFQDPSYLLYALQYLPITFAITWSYEYSGSLWTAILFHMSNNYLALTIMQLT